MNDGLALPNNEKTFEAVLNIFERKGRGGAPGLKDPESSSELLRAASLVCMMPRSKSNPDVIARRKAAVATRTSTTNWSDRFINADKFPQIAAVEDSDKYAWPPEPQLNHNQMRLVGWSEEELAGL